jgi:hypothetical protein
MRDGGIGGLEGLEALIPLSTTIDAVGTGMIFPELTQHPPTPPSPSPSASSAADSTSSHTSPHTGTLTKRGAPSRGGGIGGGAAEQLVGQKRGASSQEDPVLPDDPNTKQRKKTAHNAIERKYRTSINDRIGELKACLPLDMQKSSKSRASKAGILSKCLDYIKHLEKQNKALQCENRMLRDHRGGGAGTPPMPGSDGTGVGLGGLVTPEAGKALLCVMACGVVFAGSHGYVPGGGAGIGADNVAGEHHLHTGGRVLQTVVVGAVGSEDNALAEWSSFNLVFLLTWTVRLAFGFALFCLLCMRDLVTDPAGAEEHEQKCAVAMIDGDMQKAKHHATKALSLLGHPFPTSRIAVVKEICTGFLRQLSHRVLVGQLVSQVRENRCFRRSSHFAVGVHDCGTSAGVVAVRLRRSGGCCDAVGWVRLRRVAGVVNFAFRPFL